MSREEITGTLKEFLRVFPDFHWRIDELIAVGNKVITRVSMSGTHEGEYQGLPATGNKIETSAIFITRIENGMIVEDKEEDNALGMMMQLGMELKPKEGEK
jgi:predicted ester cyclase